MPFLNSVNRSSQVCSAWNVQILLAAARPRVTDRLSPSLEQLLTSSHTCLSSAPVSGQLLGPCLPPLPPDGSHLASRPVFFRPPSIWLLYRNPTFHIVFSLDHPMHGNITMSSPSFVAWTSAAPDGRSQLFWPSTSQGREARKLNSNVCHWHLASPMAHVLRRTPRFQKSQYRNTAALLTRTRTARRGHSTPPRLSRLRLQARKGTPCST